MLTPIDVLLRSVDQAFDRRSWHGTNLRGSIRGVTSTEASWRPSPGRHSIREIVVHAAYWKYAVARRLRGEPAGSFPLEGSNWFSRPAVGASSDQQWRADVALLVSTHRRFRAAVAALSTQQLDGAPAAGGKETVFSLITGIVAHDVYHAGQIQLLKRLRAGAASAPGRSRR